MERPGRVELPSPRLEGAARSGRGRRTLGGTRTRNLRFRKPASAPFRQRAHILRTPVAADRLRAAHEPDSATATNWYSTGASNPEPLRFERSASADCASRVWCPGWDSNPQSSRSKRDARSRPAAWAWLRVLDSNERERINSPSSYRWMNPEYLVDPLGIEPRPTRCKRIVLAAITMGPEPPAGIEPALIGFVDRCLSAWLQG